MKRKLLILAEWYPSKASRVHGIFVQDQAQVLSRAYEVAVLVFGLISWRDVIRGKFLLESEFEQRNGVKVYREEILVPPRRFFRLWIRLIARLARRGFGTVLTNWGKPDIMHGQVILPAGWVAASLGRQYGIPVVLTEHSGPFSVHLRSKSQRTVVRETLTRVNRVVAVSPALVRQIHDFCPTVNIATVGNVIRTDFFTPVKDTPEQTPPAITRFLSVASLNKEKGLQYLLEALKLLVQRGTTSFELFIGGGGPTRPRLEVMARKFGLRDRCHFLGVLTRPAVKHWMHQCDAFVLPSLSETFSVVLCEAMACGKPVIATRCGGPEFVVTPETGFLVDVANPVELAGAMDKFISDRVMFDPNLIRRSIVGRFGEDVFLRNISAIYEEIWKENLQ